MAATDDTILDAIFDPETPFVRAEPIKDAKEEVVDDTEITLRQKVFPRSVDAAVLADAVHDMRCCLSC